MITTLVGYSLKNNAVRENTKKGADLAPYKIFYVILKVSFIVPALPYECWSVLIRALLYGFLSLLPDLLLQKGT